VNIIFISNNNRAEGQFQDQSNEVGKPSGHGIPAQSIETPK